MSMLRIFLPFVLVIAILASAAGAQETRQMNPIQEKFGLESGCYDVKAKFGDTEFAGQLKLEQLPDEIRGQLTLEVGFKLHIALRTDQIKPDIAIFKTSSPATEVNIQLDGDEWIGEIIMLGNRELEISGTREKASELEEGFGRPLDQAPFEFGSISTREAGQAFITFTPDGNQAIVSQYVEDFSHHRILHSQHTDQGWSAPVPVSFSGKFSDRAPMFSLDGTKLYFSSTRPLPGEDEPGDYNLWMVGRKEDGTWSPPQPVTELNSDEEDYQPYLTRDGTIFFSSKRDGSQDLYRATLRTDGQFDSPEKLSEQINTEHDEMGCCVDPDKRFIIFSTSAPLPGTLGDDDLFVSFATDSGWTEPHNLGSLVNSFANEYGPTLSADGKYLYFSSDRSPPANVYRVPLSDLDALESVRSKD